MTPSSVAAIGSGPHGAGSPAALLPGTLAHLPGSEWDHDWSARAACSKGDPDELFVQGAEQNRAKQRCMGCLVRTECLADALDNRVEFGVWGGMTERERRALLRRNPQVTSWRGVLADARRAWVSRAV